MLLVFINVRLVLGFWPGRYPLYLEAAIGSTPPGLLMLRYAPNQLWAIEIKRSMGDPKPRKGFFIGREDIGAVKQVVLYPGDEIFNLDAKTEAMPLRAFLSQISSRQPA